jgi:hypothetical protein
VGVVKRRVLRGLWRRLVGVGIIGPGLTGSGLLSEVCKRCRSADAPAFDAAYASGEVGQSLPPKVGLPTSLRAALLFLMPTARPSLSALEALREMVCDATMTAPVGRAHSSQPPLCSAYRLLS